MNRITPLFLFCLALALLFFTVTGDHGLLQYQQLEHEQQMLEQKNRELESEITSLQNKVYGIRQDPAYLEKASREQLGLSKPGEIVYIFPDPEKQSK